MSGPVGPKRRPLRVLSEILKQGKKAEEDKLDESIQEVLKLTQPSAEDLGSIVEIKGRLSHLTPEERTPLVEKLDTFVKSFFPQAEDTTTETKIEQIIGGIEDRNLRKNVLKILSLIPADQRIKVLDFTIAFLEGLPKEHRDLAFQTYQYQESIRDLLTKIGEMPDEQGTKFVELAKSLTKGIKDGNDRLALVKALGDVSENKWTGIEIAMSAIQIFKTSSQRADMLTVITMLPEESIKPSNFISIFGFFRDIKDDESPKDDQLLRSSVLNFLKTIPEEKRDEFFDCFLSVNNIQKKEYFKYVSSLPEKEKNDATQSLFSFLEKNVVRGRMFLRLINQSPEKQNVIIDLANHVITDKSTLEDTESVMRTLEQFPAEEREIFIDLVLPLLQGIEDGAVAATIIKAFSKVPEGDREEFAKGAVSQLEGKNEQDRAVFLVDLTIEKTTEDENLRKNVSQTLSSLPADQRLKALDFTIAFFEELSEEQRDYSSKTFQNALKEMLTKIGEMPEDEGAKFVELAKSLIVGIEKGNHRIAILRTLFGMPEAQRTVIESAVPSIQSIEDGFQRADILTAMRMIPVKYIEDFDVLIPVFQKITDESLRGSILLFLKGIPEAERFEFFRGLASISDAKQKEFLLYVSGLPENERPDAFRSLFESIDWLEGYPNLWTFSSIIKGNEEFDLVSAIVNADIPREEKAQVVSFVAPVIQDIEDESEKLSVLRWLLKILTMISAGFWGLIMPIFKNFTDEKQREETLGALESLPKPYKKKLEAIKSTLILFRDVTDPGELEYTTDVFKMTVDFDHIPTLILLAERDEKIPTDVLKADILNALLLIAPRDRERSLDEFILEIEWETIKPGQSASDEMLKLVFQKEEIRDHTKVFLLDTFESEGSRPTAKILANAVKTHSEILKIKDEDVLMEIANRILEIS